MNLGNTVTINDEREYQEALSVMEAVDALAKKLLCASGLRSSRLSGRG